MSALDELLKKEYWERDYDDKGEYWWYCGGDDPKIAREELEAMKARIAELEKAVDEMVVFIKYTEAVLACDGEYPSIRSEANELLKKYGGKE